MVTNRPVLSYNAALPSASQRDDEDETPQQHLAMTAAPVHLLHDLAHALQQVESMIDQIDTERLGSAIQRGCQDAADVCAQLAAHLEGQTEEERRAMAQACVEDAQLSLELYYEDHPEERGDEAMESLRHNVDENGMIQAIRAASALLRDMEGTLRSTDRQDADDIAELAMLVARNMIQTWQAVLPSVQSTTYIEELDDDNEEETSNEPEAVKQQRRQQRQQQQQQPRASSHRPPKRVRALWPPLAPKAMQAAQSIPTKVKEHPLWSVILFWPTVWLTIFGTPLVLADSVVQHVYDSQQDSLVVQGLELTAANVWSTAQLGFKSSRFFLKQSWKVACRQAERHGGWQYIVQDVSGWTLDRVTHPVETFGAVWEGVHSLAGWMQDQFQQHHDDYTQQTLQQ